MKVTYKKLNSANIHIDNSEDTSRIYNISCDVTVGSNNNIDNFNSGTISLKDTENSIASFNSYGTNNLSINYYGEVVDKCAVLEAIEDFMEEAKAFVNTSAININE